MFILRASKQMNQPGTKKKNFETQQRARRRSKCKIWSLLNLNLFLCRFSTVRIPHNRHIFKLADRIFRINKNRAEKPCFATLGHCFECRRTEKFCPPFSYFGSSQFASIFTTRAQTCVCAYTFFFILFDSSESRLASDVKRALPMATSIDGKIEYAYFSRVFCKENIVETHLIPLINEHFHVRVCKVR